MGIYLNPGNDAFKDIRSDTYVDKTGLIDFVNGTICTPRRFTCFSRPRRFGKSYAAKMLCAYYSSGCDSHELFNDLEISKSSSFEKYMNKLNVIYIDITRTISIMHDVKKVVSNIESATVAEIRTAYPDCVSENETILANAIMAVTEKTGTQFFFIIDEWDALFREAKNDADVQKEYIQLLRGLFKGGPATDMAVAGAYMTGILPIKKYSTQSALTDFIEYTIVEPRNLVPYIGFTESEVEKLCEKNGMDFDNMKKWYDGYVFKNGEHVYNPNSVMKAITFGDFGSYWTSSESFEALSTYISMNFDGLKDAVIAMLAGMPQRVNPLNFQNDMTTFKNKDNVLTLLIHLGYLTYDSRTHRARIPNLEVSDSFQLAVEDVGWNRVAEAVNNSEDLILATIHGDTAAVEDALEKARLRD